MALQLGDRCREGRSGGTRSTQQSLSHCISKIQPVWVARFWIKAQSYPLAPGYGILHSCELHPPGPCSVLCGLSFSVKGSPYLCCVTVSTWILPGKIGSSKPFFSIFLCLLPPKLLEKSLNFMFFVCRFIIHFIRQKPQVQIFLSCTCCEGGMRKTTTATKTLRVLEPLVFNKTGLRETLYPESIYDAHLVFRKSYKICYSHPLFNFYPETILCCCILDLLWGLSLLENILLAIVGVVAI